jgi:hypothetical protein
MPRPSERFLYEVLPVVALGVGIAVLATSSPAKAAAKPAKLPAPANVVGRPVGGVQPGVVYRIVANPTGLPRDVTLRIDAYPAKRSLEGKTFLLGATIDAHGMNHPTVRQVLDVLAE